MTRTDLTHVYFPFSNSWIVTHIMTFTIQASCLMRFHLFYRSSLFLMVISVDTDSCVETFQ